MDHVDPGKAKASYIRQLERNLSLRVRTCIKQTFWSIGLWPEPSEYARFGDDQYLTGLLVNLRILPEILGTTDFIRLLNGEVLTPMGGALSRNLPSMAAFGQTFAVLIHRFLGGSDEDRILCADACSLFNIGISMFDYVVDNDGWKAEQMFKVLDKRRLSALLLNDAAIQDLQICAERTHIEELHILYKLIACFFARMHHLSARCDQIETFDELAVAIGEAYEAEIETRLPSAKSEVELARRKSCLPFRVMYLLILLSRGVNQGKVELAHKIVEAIAEVFWLVDDLADIVTDSRFGHPNSILALVRKAPLPEFHYENLCSLSSAEQVEVAVANLVMRINDVSSLLETSDLPTPSRRSILRFLTMYVRGWVSE